MSKVRLETVLYYAGGQDRRPIEKEIPLVGLDGLFRNVSFPTKGPTFLYGNNNPATAYLLKKAVQMKQCAALVEIDVDIGKWHRHKTDLTDNPESGLQFTNFLSVMRAKKDLIELISKVWVQNIDPAEDTEWPRGPTVKPFLLDKLVEYPEFEGLAVIAYPVLTHEVGVIQCATVFNTDNIQSYDGGYLLQETDITL